MSPVRLEHETHVKYETYWRLNTDANVKYWGPMTYQSLYIPQTVFKLSSVTHFLIPLDS